MEENKDECRLLHHVVLFILTSIASLFLIKWGVSIIQSGDLFNGVLFIFVTGWLSLSGIVELARGAFRHPKELMCILEKAFGSKNCGD